ncbi:hypothetical protein HNO89_003012 [Sporosarcina luteola]|nr:hypothetical protein [Sporosarcina luteola]
MDFRELIQLINDATEKLDLVSARKYIEDNLELLKENKHLLRGNSRALLDLLAENDVQVKPLNRIEMNIIQAINIYASKFDLRGLRISAKNNTDLLLRPDVKYYLNEDAKFLLEGMKAIH